MMQLSVNIQKRLGDFFLDSAFEAGGEILALLGASGCGKSMTLKCIAGIEKPDRGKIVLNGKVLFDSENNIDLPPQKRGVGYLFQQYALFPNMTVEQNISTVLRSLTKAERNEKVTSIISSMQLNGLTKKYPRELSGGQQQRVALARILASSPEAILLDEPFSALDSYLKWQLENEISDILADFGGPIIWVSHDRDEVYRNCKKICVMDKGKTVKTETVKGLFANPETVSAAMLTGCKNFVGFEPFEKQKIYIPDWDIYLKAESEPKENQHFLGIRAHNITINSTESENTFDCEIVRITEDTFSFILMLKPVNAKPSAPLIRLETEKCNALCFNKNDVIKVKFAPPHLMLLE